MDGDSWDPRSARQWLNKWRLWADSRDDLVRKAAREAGLPKAEIMRLTGLARTTIDRILSEGDHQ